ncbi:MAG: hypothetical protein ACRC6V_18110 [Bacteroidales bacterium]
MRYKAYGHLKGDTTVEKTYYNGTYGCWGALHKSGSQGGKSQFVITNIDYNPPNGESSRAHALGYRPRQILSENEQTRDDAIDRATLLIEAVVGKNMTFEFEVNRPQNQIWIKFSGFQHLPRNHVMWYMFAVRNLFEMGASHMVKEMKKRGIKSLRKLVIASLLMTFYKDSILPDNDWIGGTTTGGGNFLASHTCTADIRRFYRGCKLMGPADTSFAEGNGYDCKHHGYGIQFSNCSSVSDINRNHLEQGFRRWDKEVIDPSLFQAAFVKGRTSCEQALDQLSAYLKLLK